MNTPHNGGSGFVCDGLKKKKNNCTAAHQQGAIRLLWVLILYFWAVVRLDEQKNRWKRKVKMEVCDGGCAAPWRSLGSAQSFGGDEVLQFL